MNPFDLRGPEFLLFYLVLGALTFLALLALDRWGGRPARGTGLLRDPYLIAGLRGGEAEMARLAVLSLMARGVLVEADKRRVARSAGAAGRPASVPVGSPYAPAIEEAVELAFRDGPRTIARLHRDGAVQASMKAPLASLRASGLLPSADAVAGRLRRATGVGVVLLGVAAIKFVVALQRGRSNLLFLFLLAGLFAWGLSVWARAKPQSREGRRVLGDLRTLFGTRGVRVPKEAIEGSASELLLAAAVGGIGGGPFFVRPIARGEGGGASCGAGFSGGGSSCGGGCGGGGCGGCGS